MSSSIPTRVWPQIPHVRHSLKTRKQVTSSTFFALEMHEKVLKIT